MYVITVCEAVLLAGVLGDQRDKLDHFQSVLLPAVRQTQINAQGVNSNSTFTLVDRRKKSFCLSAM